MQFFNESITSCRSVPKTKGPRICSNTAVPEATLGSSAGLCKGPFSVSECCLLRNECLKAKSDPSPLHNFSAQFFQIIIHIWTPKKKTENKIKKYVYVYACVPVRARPCTGPCACACPSVRACVRACVCAWVCASCICASACLCVCVFACLCANLFCFCSFWRSGCWTPMYCCSMRCRTRASAWIWINTQYCPAPSKKW